MNTQPRNNMARDIFLDLQDKYDKGIHVKNPEILLDNLTDRQRNFVIEFLKDLDATRAVLAAGYKTKYPNRIAFQLVRTPKIKLTIELLQIKRAEKSSVTKDLVIRKVLKIIEECERDNTNPNAALRGLELIARHLGMFIDRTEITGRDGEAIKYEKIEEDARDFASAIDSLVERNRPDRVALKVVGGTES